ncbi:ABC transporter ATP-binding protein [Tepidibacter mesophilus]|uniref:ABC transporter ATP-binding protein n=1 Tax=Tepidibacter mesophilus TaxID=655607 RepID=UPI000C08AB68|nr:ABC transporter ATP-binding protein [Tepidibacter mesophilus]
MKEYIQFYKTFILKYWKLLSLAILFFCFEMSVSLVMPYITKILLDDVLANKDFQRFKTCITVLIVILVIQSIASFAKSMIYATVESRIVKDIRLSLFEHCLKVKAYVFEKMTVGEIIVRLENDVNKIQQSGIFSLIDVFFQTLSLIGTIIIMFTMEWQLTCVSLVIIGMYFYIYYIMSKKIEKSSKEHREAETDMIGFIGDAINGLRMVQYNNAQNWIKKLSHKQYNNNYDKTLSLNYLWSFNKQLSMVLITIAWCALWGFGGYKVLKGITTVGTIIALTNYQSRLFSPMRLYSQFNNNIKALKISITRINEIFNLDIEEEEGFNIDPLECKGKITLKNLSFKYPESKFDILKNVNATFKPGEVTLISGKSGCGKSTLMKLLMKELKPDSGEIILDKQPCEGLSTSCVRRLISYIPQELDFLKTTIFENIVLGNENVSLDIIDNMAEILDIKKTIDILPEKYEHQLLSKGNNFSGGQKKRLGILRAFVRNSKVIVFDEVMSSLDEERRRKIVDLIKNIKKDKTIIVISHYIEDIEYADKVYKFDNGELIEVSKVMPVT